MYISEKVLESLSVTVDVFDTLSVTLPLSFVMTQSGCVMVDVGVCVSARTRARVCAFYFRLCTCACGGVTRQSPQQSSPKVTEQREEVGQGHSQPLSLII